MSEDSHPNENLVVVEPDPDPADEAAGSRPERPQSRGVTRRALLGGTALGAGLLAYTSDYEDGGMTHSIARAATVPDEPLITVGPESDPVGYIFESNGDWVFKHEASGNEFFYNSTDDRWETNQELDVPALVTDKLVIGGTLYEQDGTYDQSNVNSFQYTLNTAAPEVIILPDIDSADLHSFDEMQVNGDTGANYDYLLNADTRTTGANQWNIPTGQECLWYHIKDIGNGIAYGAPLAHSGTGEAISGRNFNVSGNITSFTFIDSAAGGDKDGSGRVYRRVMDV